jgi:hypothetical protein
LDIEDQTSSGDLDYEGSIASSQADVLSTDYLDGECTVTDVSIGDAYVDSALSMYKEHKKSFYLKIHTNVGGCERYDPSDY